MEMIRYAQKHFLTLMHILQDVNPSWGYATKKTIGNGFLNFSLLLSNAANKKALFELHEGDRSAFWIALVVLISISLILQVRYS